MRFFLIAVLAFAQSMTPAKNVSGPPIQDDRLVRDLHDKDIEDVLTLYTPRAVFIDVGGKAYKGLDEIRKLYEQVADAYDSDIHLTTTSLRTSATAAIEHGTFTETCRNRATGATQQLHGTYVFLHEKQSDGTWLIAHQKLTTDTPLH